jgi:hypothetical protein
VIFAVRGGDLKGTKKTAEEYRAAKKRVSKRRSRVSALAVAKGLIASELQEAGPIKDIPQLRGSIQYLIRRAAETIAIQVIGDAKSGQLPAVRYLFEFAGLHPATEQTTERPIEKTLAHTLLTRMGLPIEPLVEDEDIVLPPAMRGSGEVSAEDTVE